MWQTLLVGLIVAVAVLFAGWHLMPASCRSQLARTLARRSRQAGLLDATQADRLQQQLARRPGCGSCEGCQGCGPQTGTPPGK